jgi:hypothetical protein
LGAVLFLWQAAILFQGIPSVVNGQVNFRQRYTAGAMVRARRARELYDADSSRLLQDVRPNLENAIPARDSATVDRVVYEALLSAPLSLLNYRTAYLVSFAANLMLLTLTVRTLRPWIGNLEDLWSWNK